MEYKELEEKFLPQNIKKNPPKDVFILTCPGPKWILKETKNPDSSYTCKVLIKHSRNKFYGFCSSVHCACKYTNWQCDKFKTEK